MHKSANKRIWVFFAWKQPVSLDGPRKFNLLRKSMFILFSRWTQIQIQEIWLTQDKRTRFEPKLQGILARLSLLTFRQIDAVLWLYSLNEILCDPSFLIDKSGSLDCLRKDIALECKSWNDLSAGLCITVHKLVRFGLGHANEEKIKMYECSALLVATAELHQCRKVFIRALCVSKVGKPLEDLTHGECT